MATRNFFILFFISVIACAPFPSFGADVDSLQIINSKNWAQYIGDHLGFLYDSHGCLHFTPSDIYLLTKTIDKRTSLNIKSYGQKSLPEGYLQAPFFCMLVNSSADLKKYADLFTPKNTKLVVYPGLGQLFILVDNKPFAKVKTLAGPEKFYRQVFDVRKNAEIDWDTTLMTPTDSGQYFILGSTSHYISNTYRQTTTVPFGGWIIKDKGAWIYQDDNKWYQLPAALAADLEKPYGQQEYYLYDLSLDDNGKIKSARWAGNDFGKDALLWSTTGRSVYPELGYAEGLILYEQTMLVKDLAQILTVSGPDTLDDCVAQNNNFVIYRDVYNFLTSKGETQSDRLDPTACSYVKLFRGFNLNNSDRGNIDDRVLQAFNAYAANKLPLLPGKRQRILGLYNYARSFALEFDKEAGYYGMLKDDWDFFSDFRQKLRVDFAAYGLYSQINKQFAIEKFLNDRLEFKLVTPPPKKQVPSFIGFFKPEPEISLYKQREKDALRKIILLSASGSGEAPGLQFDSVKALNDYNFGLLLNNMLGNLYKSHGCLHISPRNAYLTNELLPTGSKITIKKYTEKINLSHYNTLPFLSEMVNFKDDLQTLADKFTKPEDVQTTVYPGSSLWLIYLKNQPFAKMAVEPGFPFTVKILKERDQRGYPVFSDEIAYPTPAENFYVFKKWINYVSNIYYDTTIVPQDAKLKKSDGKWLFLNEKGKWTKAPDLLRDDLNLPDGKRTYEYYDFSYDSQGKLIGAKFGSNTFGRYPMQLSRDKRTPAPELVHTTGDLMMEERNLIGELIKVLSAPKDSFEECAKYSKDYDLYAACYNFIQNPAAPSELLPIDTASYKLYMEIPMTEEERAVIPKDALAAYKIHKNQGPLTKEESDLLVKEGIAAWKGKELQPDMAKVYGLLYDLYQYVVSIQKNANIYSVLKENWPGLSTLRGALLSDFSRFMVNDPEVFKEFIRELIINRVRLKHLSQKEAYQILQELLSD